MKFYLVSLVAFAALSAVYAECPNACSGHGDCSKFDMCVCWRNWQSADCSERTCQFDVAHVDTPKGDLDHSGEALTGPTTSVISGSFVYPEGTTEQFPSMEDSAGTSSTETAHYYMECSNKGLCDRKAGECKCFDGYEGSACQRASCPNECSSHGVCKTIEQVSYDDDGNWYRLWDRSATMGCVCDAGFYGADCSSRRCKYGVDPLYIDDEANSRYTQYNLNMAKSGSDPSGTFAIVFYDVFGEDWTTESITVEEACTNIVSALEGLPNTVIPEGSVECTFTDGTNEYDWALQFMGNPGYLKEIEVDWHLDGGTATLDTDTVTIFSTDTMGEFVDHVPTRCEGVTVTTAFATNVVTVTVLDYDDSGSNTNEIFLLKSCLGTSDYDADTNQDVNNWDSGEGSDTQVTWPHLVKFVEVDTTSGGYYALLYFDATNFLLLHDVGVTSGNAMHIFTTDATMQLVFTDADADTHYDSTVTNEAVFTVSSALTTGLRDIELSGAADCETGASTISHCINKGDMIMFSQVDFSVATADEGVPTGEFYTVERAWTVHPDDGTDTYWIRLDRTVNSDFTAGRVHLFSEGDQQYEYVSECSNRGLCNSEEGQCECFKGYTDDNCNTQSAIAV